MNRRDYHRAYYWRNVARRREQRMASKRGECGKLRETIRVSPNLGDLLRGWR